MTHDIERALVGAVMTDGDNFERVREVVNPDSFSDHALGNAWRAMGNLHERVAGIDTVTVGDELERMGVLNDFTVGSWSGRALDWVGCGTKANRKISCPTPKRCRITPTKDNWIYSFKNAFIGRRTAGGRMKS